MKEARTVVLLSGLFSGREVVNMMDSGALQTRLQFNWGYHEAAQDRLHQKPKRSEFSGCGKTLAEVKAYAAGYGYGWLDAVNGVYANNSEDAWKAHTEKSESA